MINILYYYIYIESSCGSLLLRSASTEVVIHNAQVPALIWLDSAYLGVWNADIAPPAIYHMTL